MTKTMSMLKLLASANLLEGAFSDSDTEPKLDEPGPEDLL
jgi:hypothetical protein